jgi:hypothetical protein
MERAAGLAHGDIAPTFLGAQINKGCINGLSIVRKYLFAGAITIMARIGDRMLDGKRYYAAFPDENPERPIPQALLNALEELEAQFRKHIKEFRRQSGPQCD